MQMWILVQLVKPALRRVGTALAAFLAGRGIPDDTISIIVTGAVAAAGVIIDLVASSKDRA